MVIFGVIVLAGLLPRFEPAKTLTENFYQISENLTPNRTKSTKIQTYFGLKIDSGFSVVGVENDFIDCFQHQL